MAAQFPFIPLLRQCLEQYIAGQPRPPLTDLLAVAPSPLAQLARKFQLSALEQGILLFCLGLELEANLQSLCGQALGREQATAATLGLALSLFAAADWSALSHQCPLHQWQLVHTTSGPWLLQAPLSLDRRILCYLLGTPDLAPPLADWLTPLTAARFPATLPPSYQALSDQIAQLWSGVKGIYPLIVLVGRDPLVHQQLVAQASDRLRLQLLALPDAVLPSLPGELKGLQRQWEREAILRNGALLLRVADLREGGHKSAIAFGSAQSAIALFLNTISTPVMVSSRDRLPPLNRAVITLEVPPLPHAEQRQLWQQQLQAAANVLKPGSFNGPLDRLISQFQLTPTTIQTVTQQLHQQALTGRDADTIATELWHFCRQQARPNLDDLAQRIPAQATWENLVLPDRQRQQLEDIVDQLQLRAGVYQNWGFAGQGSRGLGLAALFCGESGTGKTMAAEVVAAACQLDLYRIDLSTVVSKYIGETEKNLRRIFDAAEAGGVILLFDEADALFGKRSEVKDSRDRHANIEVSYLLQRMEAYQGLAILTSNLKQNLDPAFLRRLRFIITFPFPKPESRAAIWQRIFPRQTPTQDLDFAKLAQLKIAGGNIRNIALGAAFLAAKEQHPVTMAHIRQAAQRDYLKLEKLLTQEETAGWDEVS